MKKVLGHQVKFFLDSEGDVGLAMDTSVVLREPFCSWNLCRTASMT
jgi:hypothetical protein